MGALKFKLNFDINLKGKSTSNYKIVLYKYVIFVDTFLKWWQVDTN